MQSAPPASRMAALRRMQSAPCPSRVAARGAQVALEFHQMRDQYPEWFHSQFGNKLWCAARTSGPHARLHRLPPSVPTCVIQPGLSRLPARTHAHVPCPALPSRVLVNVGGCRYTGVGAKDMLAQSSLHLSRRIRVECDGVHLALPPDTEGILLLNIPSYMGGVDLWASGELRLLCPSPPLHHSPSLEHLLTVLTLQLTSVCHAKSARLRPCSTRRLWSIF